MVWRLLVIAGLVTLLLQLTLGRPELMLKDFVFGGILVGGAVICILGPFWKARGGARRNPEA